MFENIVMIHRFSNKITAFLFVILTSVFVVFFAYNITWGKFGALPMMRTQEDLYSLQKELDESRIESMNLENRVRLLRSESLDKDLLDELARNMLGKAHSQDNVLMIINDEK